MRFLVRSPMCSRSITRAISGILRYFSCCFMPACVPCAFPVNLAFSTANPVFAVASPMRSLLHPYVLSQWFFLCVYCALRGLCVSSSYSLPTPSLRFAVHISEETCLRVSMSIGALPCFCLLSHVFLLLLFYFSLLLNFLFSLVNVNLCGKENKPGVPNR